MPFQVSPGVVVNEVDLTTVVPAVSTTEGAIAGLFRWGPVEQPILISSEDELTKRFATPTNDNFETFFSAAAFLSYGNKLFVSRAADSNAFNAVANTDTVASIQLKNEDDYVSSTMPANALYFAKYPGVMGNSLRISVCDSANAYHSTVGTMTNANNSAEFTFTSGTATGIMTVTNVGDTDPNTAATTEATTVLASIQIGDRLLVGNTSVGQQFVKVIAKSTPVVTSNGVVTATLTLDSRVSSAANLVQTTVERNWEFFDAVSAAPGTSTYVSDRGGSGDEMHVVVIDEAGEFTGSKGAVLELFEGVSRARDAKGEQGGSIYYKDTINSGSQYVWWAGDRAGAVSNTAANVIASTNVTPLSQRFISGTDSAAEDTIAISSLAAAWDVFKNAEAIDVSLLVVGKARGGSLGEQLPNYIIDNIAEYRKDCIAFISPDRATVVNNVNGESTDTVAFRNLLRSTSYAVLDSGYKYTYDKYNDVYRYVPLCGDIAGLAVRTDETRDPWFSPAGFNRGQIKNIVKLAWNPDKAARDVLYKNGVNPVVSFPGQGTVLYGDKTLLAKPSAFDRINVRRLFIVLEKAIATASKFTLFEFNDEFTRAQFRNLVEPFLRDVQGRRGLYDYHVVCDETNNTPEVIDRNEFIGSIYLKPAKSINYITLNFVAVRTGVEFEEIVGRV
jgi:hypothetical protein